MLVSKELGKWHLDAIGFDGTTERLGTIEIDFERGLRVGSMDLETGRFIAINDEGSVSVIEIGADRLAEPRQLGRHDGSNLRIIFHPRGERIATTDSSGEIRIWDPKGRRPAVSVQGPTRRVNFGVQG